MKTMKVLIIDDESEDVQLLIDSLRSTALIEVKHERNYLNLGPDDGAVCQFVARYDLLLLDVLVGASTTDFQRIVSAIAGKKPFLAYTQFSEDHDLSNLGSFAELREIVLLHGGLGVITKSFSRYQSKEINRPSQRDMTFRILESVLWFYWTGFR